MAKQKLQKSQDRDNSVERSNEVVALLAELGNIRAKAMFGGFGLFQGETFFGLIAGGRLYFKVSDATREEYVVRQSTPFSPWPGRTMKSYYEVPKEVFDNDEELIRWARIAVQVAEVA